MTDIAYSPFLRRYVMAKPVSSRCNLGCSYCYYLGAARVVPPQQMSDAVLEAYIKQYIALTPVGEEVSFCWHGGEPLLLQRSFFEQVLALQRHYADGHPITNVLQTNGTLLNDEWCRFFADEQFLVGISLDGDEDCHNHYRTTRTGIGSFRDTMRGIDLLNRYGADYNILAVINDYTAARPREVYRFLRSVGSPYLQFSPNVEWLPSGQLTPSSVSPEAFGSFYCAVFDEWYAHDIGHTFVELFDTTLALLMGFPPPSCVFGETCGNAAVLEANGNLFTCDHFVAPDALSDGASMCLGNILDTPLQTMLYSPAMQAFGEHKAALSDECRSCSYLRLCYGECPHHRFPLSSSLESSPSINYLCTGYRAYFAHTLPYFTQMESDIRGNNSIPNSPL